MALLKNWTKIIAPGILGFLLIASLPDAVADERFEQVFMRDLQSVAFYPLGSKGIFSPGEEVRLVLALRNKTSQEAAPKIEYVVKNYAGKEILKQTLENFTVAPEQTRRIELVFPGSEETGYYTVDALVSLNGKKILKTQSAFVLLEPMSDPPDPFFQIDKNYPTVQLLDGYKLLGAGSIGFYQHWWDMPEDISTEFQKRFQDGGDLKAYLDAGLELAGSVAPLPRYAAFKDQIRRGLPVLSAKEVLYVERFAETLAKIAGHRVKYWLVTAEIDVMARRPDITGGNAASVLADYAYLARAMYNGFKRAMPDIPVVVLGIAANDYLHSNPPFQLSRIALDSLGKNFDLLAIDAYSGNWDSLRGPIDPPEKSLRQFLLDTIELSKEYGRPGKVINAERCYSVNYSSAFDSENLRQVAEYTLRSMIINRSVPSPYYSLHVACNYAIPRQIRDGHRNADSPILDLGALWKAVLDENGEIAFIPRPTAIAFATAARELAFVSNPQEIKLASGVHAYLFTRKDNKETIAVWTTEEPVMLELDFPVVTGLTTMNGVKSVHKPGPTSLEISGAPIFLQLDAPRETVSAMIAKATIPQATLCKGGGWRTDFDHVSLQIGNLTNEPLEAEFTLPDSSTHPLKLPANEVSKFTFKLPRQHVGNTTAALTANGIVSRIPLALDYWTAPKLSKPWHPGTWFEGLTPIKLKVPDDFYPKWALVPEMDLVKLDGSDVSAEVYVAWDEKYLHVAAKVFDPVHIQRGNGVNIEMDDMFNFVIGTRQDPTPEALLSMTHVHHASSFSGEEQNLGLALTTSGPVLARLPGAGASPGKLNWPHTVTRSGNITLYEAAIPWREIRVSHPRYGLGLRFGFIVRNNDRPEDRRPIFHLAYTEGIDGQKNASKLKPLILGNP